MFLQKQHLLFYLQIVREVETENKINFLDLLFDPDRNSSSKMTHQNSTVCVIFDLEIGHFLTSNLDLEWIT